MTSQSFKERSQSRFAIKEPRSARSRGADTAVLLTHSGKDLLIFEKSFSMLQNRPGQRLAKITLIGFINFENISARMKTNTTDWDFDRYEQSFNALKLANWIIRYGVICFAITFGTPIKHRIEHLCHEINSINEEIGARGN